jgi:hypothetical protein
MSAIVYESKVKGPATYAIVIGVGHYPHLRGGKSKPKFNDESALGQLKSPPASARQIARWLIEKYDHSSKPLASVALLLSDVKDQTFTFSSGGKSKRATVPVANMSEVKEAVRAWRERGNSSPDHLLLFFFCGHGIAALPDLGLLLADFGSVPAGPLEGSIHFRLFRQNMDTCAAREQCYFIDACRVASQLLITNTGNAGQTIIDRTSDFNATGRVRQVHTYYSTLAGSSAYAQTGGKPSLFTQALLEGLEGAGCEEAVQGQWQVESVLLHHALCKLMADASQRVALPELQLSAADDNASVMLNTVSAPQIPVRVGCDRPGAGGMATFVCKNGKYSWTGKGHQTLHTWKVLVPLGNYSFDARFSAKYAVEPLTGHTIRPAFPYIELKVRP